MLTLIVLAASQRGCTINVINCMYSELPTDDEQLIYSKLVWRIFIGINLKKKVRLAGSYDAKIYHDSRFM